MTRIVLTHSYHQLERIDSNAHFGMLTLSAFRSTNRLSPSSVEFFCVDVA